MVSQDKPPTNILLVTRTRASEESIGEPMYVQVRDVKDVGADKESAIYVECKASVENTWTKKRGWNA